MNEKILIVDDSPVILNYLEPLLRNSGFTVIPTTDSLEAYSIIKNDPEIKLLITDQNMPGLDGLSLIEKIRNELNNQALIVIIATTEHNAALKKRAKEAKVLAWISKPIDDTTLPQAVIKAVRGR